MVYQAMQSGACWRPAQSPVQHSVASSPEMHNTCSHWGPQRCSWHRRPPTTASLMKQSSIHTYSEFVTEFAGLLCKYDGILLVQLLAVLDVTPLSHTWRATNIDRKHMPIKPYLTIVNSNNFLDCFM